VRAFEREEKNNYISFRPFLQNHNGNLYVAHGFKDIRAERKLQNYHKELKECPVVDTCM
jgi:hypothetical protein